MQIKITTTFNISEANRPLVPMVCNDINYEEWKHNKINNALILAQQEYPEITEEDLEVDVTQNTFMKEFLSNDYSLRLKNIVSPSIDLYFGRVMETQATAVKEHLDESITTVVEITE